MALNLNHVILAGHLTRDPQVRLLGGEKTVAEISVALNRRWKGADGETKEEVTFVDCEAWGRTAEVVGQYLVKGSACIIEGRLRQDAWTDKEGKKHSRLKVVVENIQFVGPRRGDAAARPGRGGEEGPARVAEPVAAGTADEPPF
jgi:single-strand DNA-binding protein